MRIHLSIVKASVKPLVTEVCITAVGVNWFLINVFQDLYCVRSDLGNLLKALGRLEEAKVCQNMSTLL